MAASSAAHYVNCHHVGGSIIGYSCSIHGGKLAHKHTQKLLHSVSVTYVCGITANCKNVL